MPKLWSILNYDHSISHTLQNELSLNKYVCAILVQRGITSILEAEKFLYPKLAYLRNPFELFNADVAVKKIFNAINDKKKITIIGDYDVDGITSITLFTDVLKVFDVNTRFYVPRRFTEGYGLSSDLVTRVLNDNIPDLVITLDCGTNSFAEVETLKANGCDVIVVDHHKSKIEECSNCCIINPHIYNDDKSISQRIFCTVGLVFKLCHALLQFFRKQNDKRAFNFKMRDELDLVALGTIADLVPLVGENRIFCKYGLRRLSSDNRRAGIEALCRVSTLEDGVPIYPADVAFKLSPRLNACGRLSDAILPIKMLLSNDYDEALTYAYELDETNHERQNLEKEVLAEAELIVKDLYLKDSAFVLFNENWHSGVVGIVSGKLARDYNRPCIVLGFERGVAKGSGRSVDAVNLVDVCNGCSDLLESWGGHPLAVGISIKPENIDKFREKFCKKVDSLVSEVNFNEVIDITEEVYISDIDDSFIRDLELLHPFGQGNLEPIFLVRKVKIYDAPELFGSTKNHIKFWVNYQHSKRILIIGWEVGHNIPPILVNIDLAIKISMDHWNGKKFKRFTLVDWRVSE